MTFIDLTGSNRSLEPGPAAPENAATAAVREPPLMAYFRAALRWKWVILGIIAAALLIGLLATLLMAPSYTATTRIAINRPQEDMTDVRAADRDRSVDMEFYQTQYGLLHARSLADRVVRSLNLANNPDFLRAFRLEPDVAVTGTPQRAPETARRIGTILLANVTVAPIRGSSLVDVSFTSPNAALSARLANEWARQFVEMTVANRFASSADARRILKDRLNQMRQRLEQSERDLVNFAANNQIITLRTSEDTARRTRSEQTLAAANLEQINQALAEAIAARTLAESRMIASRQGTSSAALADTTIGGLRQRRAELAAEYQRLLVQYRPEYPAARQIQVQIAHLDQAIRAEEGRVQSSYQGEYRQALARENALQARVNQLKAQLIGEQRNSIQHNIYQREVDTNRTLYDALLQRYREIGVAGVGLSNIVVVDPAQVPQSPSSPNLLLNMILALLGGSGLAALTVWRCTRSTRASGSPGRSPGFTFHCSGPRPEDVGSRPTSRRRCSTPIGLV